MNVNYCPLAISSILSFVLLVRLHILRILLWLWLCGLATYSYPIIFKNWMRNASLNDAMMWLVRKYEYWSFMVENNLYFNQSCNNNLKSNSYQHLFVSLNCIIILLVAYGIFHGNLTCTYQWFCPVTYDMRNCSACMTTTIFFYGKGAVSLQPLHKKLFLQHITLNYTTLFAAHFTRAGAVQERPCRCP